MTDGELACLRTEDDSEATMFGWLMITKRGCFVLFGSGVNALFHFSVIT